MMSRTLTRAAEKVAHEKVIDSYIVKSRSGRFSRVKSMLDSIDLTKNLDLNGRLLEFLNDKVQLQSFSGPISEFDMYSGIFGREQVFDLANETKIDKIFPDQRMNIVAQPKTSEFKGRKFTTTSWTRKALGIPDDYKYTGDGVNTAVIDTGLRRTHPQTKFAERVKSTLPGQHGEKSGHGSAPPDSLIYTSEGIMTIKEFFDSLESEEINDKDGVIMKEVDDTEVLSFNDPNVSWEDIEYAHKIPENTETVIIKSGPMFKMELTPWHKVYVFNNGEIIEKRADTIEEGDYLLKPRNCPEINDDYLDVDGVEIDEDVAYIIGMVIGDGNIQKTQTSCQGSIGNTSPHILDECVRILSDIGWSNGNIVEGYETRTDRVLIRAEGAKILNKIGIPFGKKSDSIRVPDVIAKSKRSVIISFLAGLIDSDGSVNKDRARIRYKTISKDMARTLSFLLTYIGIGNYVTVQDNRGRKRKIMNNGEVVSQFVSETLSYCVHITTSDFARLSDEILEYLVCENKKARIRKNSDTNFIGIGDVVPIDNVGMRKVLGNKGYTLGRDSDVKGVTIATGVDKYSYLKMREIVDNLDLPDYLENLIESLRFLEVDSVETGETHDYFYDLTVSNTNKYFANNFETVLISNTHCSNIIAGGSKKDRVLSNITNSNLYCEGMAPNTNIIPIKSLGFVVGTGTSSSIIKGLEYASKNIADIVNMSLGGPLKVESPEEDPYYEPIKKMAEKGMIPVCASGNSGPGRGTVTTPGAMPHGLTVGAIDADDKIAPFSSRGPTPWGNTKPDLVSYGVKINSGLAGILDSADGLVRKFSALSGTSQATPHVSGMLSIMQEMYNEMDKNLTVDEVKRMLNKLSTGMKNDNYGWGRLDIDMIKTWIDTEYGGIR